MQKYKKTFLHSRGQIRGGNDDILGKFHFFPFLSAKSPFFHHQNLKKGTFCEKIKQKHFCIPGYRGINLAMNAMFLLL